MLQSFYPYYQWIIAFFLTLLLAVNFSSSSLSSPSEVILQLNQAQTLIDQGNFNRAASLLESVEQKLDEHLLPYFEAVEANLFLRQGNYNLAIQTYSQLYSQKFGAKGANYLALLDNYLQAVLGRVKVYESLADEDVERQPEFTQIVERDLVRALDLAIEAVELAQTSPTQAQIRAKLNLGKLSPDLVQLGAITSQIESLPTSRTKTEFFLGLANLNRDSYPLLEKALKVAQEAQDNLSLSWVWGALAEYYEKKGLHQKALKASHQATWAAVEAKDWVRMIQWEWLSARVYRQLEQPNQALAAYRNAVNTVQRLRQDLAGSQVGPNLFLDTIEPLLRDFLAFLLNQPVLSQETLAETLEVMRLNSLAELDNFFGDICQVEIKSPTKPNSETLWIYTLLLPENSYEILKWPDNSYQLIKLGVPGESLKKQVLDWRKNLTDPFYGDYRPGSLKLFQILLHPLENIFESKQLTHLVFVQDSVLRNIPMSALHDGKQFLVEKYAISYSLDLGGELSSTPPQNPLILGASEGSLAFPNSLPTVRQEMKQVHALLGGTPLLNEAFSAQAVEEHIQQESYQLLHLASHSRFSGLLEEVKIQTGTGIITLREFETLLRKSKSAISHLTLSACETATGSRYAILGMAGVGIRAEISSVLGSLWFFNDAKTSNLIINFYQYWKGGNSLEESLRKSQIQQIKQGEEPMNWSSLILLRA